MDGDYIIDIQQVLDSIDEAEVVSISFRTLGRSVVIDTRTGGSEGPMVRIMPMVSSPRERARSIRRIRPGFPRVRNLAVVPWPGYVDSLVRKGIWASIERRLAESGFPKAITACEKALRELKRLEKAELVAAVTGENYHTLWSADQHRSS